MARVLLTGFGPFPGAAINPSAWLAETLPGHVRGLDCDLHAKVLPTEWAAIADLTPRLHENSATACNDSLWLEPARQRIPHRALGP